MVLESGIFLTGLKTLDHLHSQNNLFTSTKLTHRELFAFPCYSDWQSLFLFITDKANTRNVISWFVYYDVLGCSSNHVHPLPSSHVTYHCHSSTLYAADFHLGLKSPVAAACSSSWTILETELGHLH